MSLDQLNQGLDNSLAALGSGNRGAEARQQTLEATIDWSYGLLDEAEQVLWARLCLFAGGFDTAAAIEVGDDRLLDQSPEQLDDLLLRHAIVGADLDRGGRIEAPGEHTQSSPEDLLGLVKEAVAPVDRGLEGLLTGLGPPVPAPRAASESSNP